MSRERHEVTRRLECLLEHGEYIQRHLPAVLRVIENRGLARTADDIALSCARCGDDEAWEFPVGAVVRWFYCGPLGLCCECIDDDPPDGD